MSRTLPLKLLEDLQDRLPGETDDDLEELVNRILAGLRQMATPRRDGNRPPYDSDRKTAVLHLQRAEALNDPDLKRIRQLPRESRLAFLARLVRLAKSRLDVQVAAKRIVEPDRIILPGNLLGSPRQECAFLLGTFAELGNNDFRVLRWAATVAVRVSVDYGIKPRSAFLFVLVDEGFSPEPTTRWSVKRNARSPYLDRVRIEIDPYTSAEDVVAEWNRIRAQLGIGAGRKRRAKTYALARWFAELTAGVPESEIPEWKLLLILWEHLCSENGQVEWLYHPGPGFPRANVVHLFRRDVRHAMNAMRVGLPRQDSEEDWLSDPST